MYNITIMTYSLACWYPCWSCPTWTVAQARCSRTQSWTSLRRRPVFRNIDKSNIIRDYHCIIALYFEISTSLILSEIVTTIVAITNTIYETTTWTMITWILYLEVVDVICQVVDLYWGMGEHSRGLEMVSFNLRMILSLVVHHMLEHVHGGTMND